MPGCLIPADLDRMIPKGADPFKWAETNLLASPGALVGDSSTGETFRIPTLVPATKPDGSCIHLSANNLCAIHENAPFGCAFFDCNSRWRNPEAVEQLMIDGMLEVQDSFQTRALYFLLWVHLAYMGRTQKHPEELRERMRNDASNDRTNP